MAASGKRQSACSPLPHGACSSPAHVPRLLWIRRKSACPCSPLPGFPAAAARIKAGHPCDFQFHLDLACLIPVAHDSAHSPDPAKTPAAQWMWRLHPLLLLLCPLAENDGASFLCSHLPLLTGFRYHPPHEASCTDSSPSSGCDCAAAHLYAVLRISG